MPLAPERVHFVGIGGAGMSGIAMVLLDRGCKVSGSDLKKSEITDKLQMRGARVFYGHSPSHLGDAELVVYSSAVPPDNPELVTARKRGLPVVPRAEMLGRLMRHWKGIAVAGAHGKTTTTSLVAFLLERTGLDPTVIIGGEMNGFGNAKTGSGEFLVAEADESDGSFFLLDPSIVVVTNVEDDHLDYYHTVEAIRKAFREFIFKVPRDGVAVLNYDDPFLRRVAHELPVPVITYGSAPDADCRAARFHLNGAVSGTDVYWRRELLGRLELTIPGRHNLLNALAVVAVGRHVGLEFPEIAQALRNFRGVRRRFELVGESRGVRVVDDYAHHPTEVRATLEAARQTGPKRLIAVFQPHRYTRTRFLHKEFGKAFTAADQVCLTEIYPAGERPIPGVSARLIGDEIPKHQGVRPVLFEEQDQLVAYLAAMVREGDLVITLGAGDIWRTGRALLRILEGR
ncbi:MAG: UDP-N-acetylmuramate--L-alanine ligase [Bacillota bacterium]